MAQAIEQITQGMRQSGCGQLSIRLAPVVHDKRQPEVPDMTAIDQFFRDSLIISLTTYLLAGVVLAVGFVLIVRLVLVVHRQYTGTRTVTCPETEDYASVEVDAWHAAIMWLFGKKNLRVRGCSRWPERKDCNQACTWQVERNRKV